MITDEHELKHAAGQFWTRFVSEIAPLGQHIIQNYTAVFESVERALAEAGIDFVFDVTAFEDSSGLIFTPEGDEEVARAIDMFLSQRPEIPGWRIFGRRQPKSWHDALVLVGQIAEADLSDARFAVWRDRPGLAVDMVAAELAQFEEPSAKSIAMLLLHHALGEEFVMNSIQELSGHGEELPGRQYLTPEALTTFLRGLPS
ncbi:MAG TPA: hypothetical protein VF815_25030 [Myxococcaceae bacterium]|jgi:hypothetical protein